MDICKSNKTTRANISFYKRQLDNGKIIAPNAKLQYKLQYNKSHNKNDSYSMNNRNLIKHNRAF